MGPPCAVRGGALDALSGDGPPDATALREAAAQADPVGAFLAEPGGQASHPLHSLRMDLRMWHLFLTVESDAGQLLLGDERFERYLARVRAGFEGGGPHAARLPGLVWPITLFHLGSRGDVRLAMDLAVANSRRYGGDWEVAVALMFRTHMVVDSSGGLLGVDDDLAELRVLSRRCGDRWMRAQVCSAVGEAAMARGRFAQARAVYEEALGLAREVGALAESPFLLARLAEIAYRSGDRAATLRALDEASAEAERYAVVDSRAFVLLLRAQLALDDAEVSRARELWEAARAEIGNGTPPPQFMAVLQAVGALVEAGESGPEHGLPLMVEALREAVAMRCSEVVTSSLADMAADLLERLGDLPRALRLLAASDQWRGGRPRPQPESSTAERIEAAACAALPAGEVAAERERGAAFTAVDAVEELDAAVREHPARERSSRR